MFRTSSGVSSGRLVSLRDALPRSVVTWKRPRYALLLCATSVAWPSTDSLDHVASSSITVEMMPTALLEGDSPRHSRRRGADQRQRRRAPPRFRARHAHHHHAETVAQSLRGDRFARLGVQHGDQIGHDGDYVAIPARDQVLVLELDDQFVALIRVEPVRVEPVELGAPIIAAATTRSSAARSPTSIRATSPCRRIAAAAVSLPI